MGTASTSKTSDIILMKTGFFIQSAQARVLEVYGAQNERNLELSDILNRLNRRATTLLAAKKKYLRAVEQSEKERLRATLRVQTTQVFTWVCSLASSASVDLQRNLFMHFPGIDPACGEAICACGKGGRLKERVPIESLLVMAKGLVDTEDAQIMLSNIFPENQLDDTVDHLIEEIAETGEMITVAKLQGGLPAINRNLGFLLELADVTAFVIGTAALLEINLVSEVLSYLKDGCPGPCKKPACICESSDVRQMRVGSVLESSLPKMSDYSAVYEFVALR